MPEHGECPQPAALEGSSALVAEGSSVRPILSDGAITSPGSLKGTHRNEHNIPREVADGIAKDVRDQRGKVRGGGCKFARLSECALGCLGGLCLVAAASTTEPFLLEHQTRTSPSLCAESDKPTSTVYYCHPQDLRYLSDSQIDICHPHVFSRVRSILSHDVPSPEVAFASQLLQVFYFLVSTLAIHHEGIF